MLLLERQTPRFSPPSQHHGAPTHEQAGQACSATRSCTTTRHRGKRKAMPTGVPEVGHAGNCLQQPEPGDGPAHEHQRTAQDRAGLQNTDLSVCRKPHACINAVPSQPDKCITAGPPKPDICITTGVNDCASASRTVRATSPAPPATRGCFACCALVPCACTPLTLSGLALLLACSAGLCVPFPLPLGSCFVAKDPLHPSPVVKDDVQHPAQDVVGPLDEPRGPHLGPRMLPVPDRLVAQRQRL